MYTSNLRGYFKFVIVFGQCIRKSIAYSELLALGVKRCTFSIERDVGREFLEWSEPSQFDTLAPSIFFRFGSWQDVTLKSLEAK